ncbi:DUF1906 domain-containing protein [Streptomyces sp. NPDC051940]|uniref:DUF1906 domain-containing protein n=1 Tax=Streptomyces sp. NPDC051940 TaxID=3155675 RepID=UPI0034490C70
MRDERQFIGKIAPALLTALALIGVTAAAASAHEGPRAASARIFDGKAFDTCEAPSRGAMRAWAQSSPYRAVGIYVGGVNRACKTQPNLTRGWIRDTARMGWHHLPLYVGSQAPCIATPHHRIGSEPRALGRREGRDAVDRAAALGIATHSPLYLDVEAYDIGDRACARATLSFVRAWNREVRSHGYIPGFYSSSGSGVAAMERARLAGVTDLPTVMWFARWGTPPALAAEPALRAEAWRHRLHQYAGDVRESHGGVTLTIDRNVVRAPVAVFAGG